MSSRIISILPVTSNPQRRARLWQGRSKAESAGHGAKRSALARVPGARQSQGGRMEEILLTFIIQQKLRFIKDQSLLSRFRYEIVRFVLCAVSRQPLADVPISCFSRKSDGVCPDITARADRVSRNLHSFVGSLAQYRRAAHARARHSNFFSDVAGRLTMPLVSVSLLLKDLHLWLNAFDSKEVCCLASNLKESFAAVIQRYQSSHRL